MIDKNEQRERFEAWAIQNRHAKRDQDGELYSPDGSVNAMREAWLAAKRDAVEEIEALTNALKRLGELVKTTGEMRELGERIEEKYAPTINQIPVGCTPADARVLREANHALIDEIEALKKQIFELTRDKQIKARKEIIDRLRKGDTDE